MNKSPCLSYEEDKLAKKANEIRQKYQRYGQPPDSSSQPKECRVPASVMSNTFYGTNSAGDNDPISPKPLSRAEIDKKVNEQIAHRNAFDAALRQQYGVPLKNTTKFDVVREQPMSSDELNTKYQAYQGQQSASFTPPYNNRMEP